jgi:hypothetical protein
VAWIRCGLVPLGNRLLPQAEVPLFPIVRSNQQVAMAVFDVHM